MKKQNYRSICILLSIFCILLLLSHFIPFSKVFNQVSAPESEEYIWVSTMIDDPMFQNNDIPAFHQFGEEKGVKTTVMGSSEYNISAEIAALEEAAAKKPSGILVLGMEKSLAPAVNKAIEQGIPVVVVDSDLADSDRIAFVGSDWYEIGVVQAESMVKLIGGKGKIALMGIGDADTTEAATQGFLSVTDNYPDISVLGPYDDMTNSQEAARLTGQLIEEFPDIAGIAGFNTNSASGIAKGIRDSDIDADIKVTAMDIEPENLQLVLNGEVDFIVGQKRALFTYYGAQLLYDLNHSGLRINEIDNSLVHVVPDKVYTGLIKVDAANIHTLFPEL